MDDFEHQRAGFVVRVNPNDKTICILWRPPVLDIEECKTLRGALLAHRDDLVKRLETLTSLLAGGEPERADRVVSSALGVRITEMVLQPLLASERFDDLMQHAFQPTDDRS
jgi:hypothetical protein